MSTRWTTYVLLLGLGCARVLLHVQEENREAVTLEGRAGLFAPVPYDAYVHGKAVQVPSRLCREYDVPLNPTSRYIFIIERGDCPFTHKALHAQKAGAQAVVIYDNIEEGLMTMSADNLTISIPTVFVSKLDGLKLMRKSGFFSLNMTFYTPHFARPSLELVLSGDPTWSFSLIEVLKGVREMWEWVSYKTYYVVLPCTSCVTYSQPVGNCLGGGRYCSHHGVTFLKEVVRQECIFNQYNSSQYLTYMETWARECKYSKFECFSGYFQADIDPEYVQSCYNSSFQPFFSLTAANPTLARLQQEYFSLAPYFPVYISGHNFEGLATAETVKRALCASMVSPPEICRDRICAAHCWPEMLGNTVCDSPCNTSACDSDHHDCEAPTPPPSSPQCAPSCPLFALNNSYCDLPCNVSACEYDRNLCISKDIFIPRNANFEYKYIFFG